MATTEELRALLDESRNGCNSYMRHPLARKFIYTDGVQEVADLCDAHWLLDIIGTEAVPALLSNYRETYANIGLIEISVLDDKAKIWLSTADDVPAIWTRNIEYTDFPAGTWTFKLGVDSIVLKGELAGVMCLLSED